MITKKRYEAFKKTCDEKFSGINLTTLNVLNSEEAELATNKMLAKDTDVIFCMSDEILVGVMKCVQKKKLKIPKDISIISISNGFFPKLYYPEITYVETSGYKLGKNAFECMLACLNGSTFVHNIVTDCILVGGGSLS